MVLRNNCYLSIAAFFIVVLIICASIYVLIRHLERLEIADTQDQLASIARLKSGQIRGYLKGIEDDAFVYSEFLNSALLQRGQTKLSGGIPDSVGQTMEITTTVEHYSGMILLDNKAKVVLSRGRD